MKSSPFLLVALCSACGGLSFHPAKDDVPTSEAGADAAFYGGAGMDASIDIDSSGPDSSIDIDSSGPDSSGLDSEAISDGETDSEGEADVASGNASDDASGVVQVVQSSLVDGSRDALAIESRASAHGYAVQIDANHRF